MTVYKKFVVYELNNVMQSERHKALNEVVFTFRTNGFDTEEEAIQALIADKLIYEECLILCKVYINE